MVYLLFSIISLMTASYGSGKFEIMTKESFMLKLYKNIDGKLYYWETWDNDDKSAVVHWGIVGERGEDKVVKSGVFSNFRKTIQKEIDKKVNEGYSEFDEDKLIFLEIEYKIDGFGSEEDLNKRYRLEERLNQTLGWTGLGHVDGGSTGSGTMEAGCVVVDFEIAKKVIKQDLEGTEFGDYSRIYKME